MQIGFLDRDTPASMVYQYQTPTTHNIESYHPYKLAKSSARQICTIAQLHPHYKSFSLARKPGTNRHSNTPPSNRNSSSTSPMPHMKVTLSRDEDSTASLTDLINDSFTLLEHLEERAELEAQAKRPSADTTFYNIEYHANSSANAGSSSSLSPSFLSGSPSAPSPRKPTLSICRASNEYTNDMNIDYLIDLVQSDNLLTVIGKLKIMEAIMRENDLAKAYVELTQMRKTLRILWYEERFPGEWLAFGTAAAANASKVMVMPPAKEGRA